VTPSFPPPCRLCAQPRPTEPDCSHDTETQQVKPYITHVRYSSGSPAWPVPNQESSQTRKSQRTRSYDGLGSPAQPGAARRSWPRWSSTSLFDEVICPPEHRRRNGQAKRFRGLEVDDELESCGLLDGQVGRPCALQDLVHVMRRPPKLRVVAQAIGHE